MDRLKSSGPPKKKLKSINFDFKVCKIVDHARVSKDLVQINVDEDEIGRRIKNFIERKREEIDKSNIKDFIDTKDDGDDGCARVNSVIFRVKDSKGHLKGEFSFSCFYLLFSFISESRYKFYSIKLRTKKSATIKKNFSGHFSWLNPLITHLKPR